MKKPSRAGGKPAKAQRRKALKLKGRNAPKVTRSRPSSVGGKDKKIALLTRERDEALARQIATADILRVISQSPTDVRPVFDSIVFTAVRLLRCDLAFVLLCDGATYSPAAVASPEGPHADVGPTNLPIDRSANFPSRAILDKEMLHLPDWSCIDLPEHELKIHKMYGVNSALYLPLLREEECIGLLTLVGKRPNIFGAAEIAQAESFRDQALIAIENSRLFKETKEALEQQTATSEVLQVISSSPGDLEPVFETMLAKAVRICGARFGNIFRWDGDALHLLAAHNVPIAFDDVRRRLPLRPSPGPLGRMVATKTVVHVTDLAGEKSYIERAPSVVAAVELGGIRTFLAVPMLKEGELIGAFTLNRPEVRPFSEKEIALVTSFASQAVIAIENTRLLNELRESLQQQTATADVLKVISRSTFDLHAVLNTLVQSAARLCEADTVVIGRPKGESFQYEASYGFSREYAQFVASHPAGIDRGSVSGRVLLERKIVHVLDVLADPEYSYETQVGGFRTLLGVPLLREGSPIGVIALGRNSVRPFTDKQIELVSTFADQAVIAIENVRLFEAEQQRTRELTESLEQQTATSEVLQVISSSPGDLQPVFATMLENAVRICDAKFGNIYRWDGEALHLLASHNTPPALSEARKHLPLRPHPESPVGRMLAHKAAFHSADLAALPGYIDRSVPDAVAAVELGGVRTSLLVPMLKEDELIGSFTVYRQEVRPFTDKQIALVTSFAAQAVIAIENTRLLSELRESLEQQTATSEVLGVISTSPSELQPVFGAILANGARLCEANFGVLVLYENGTLRVGAMHNVPDAYAEYRRREPVVGLGSETVSARMAATKQVVHVLDYAAEVPDNPAVRLGGARSVVVVPMLKENELVGAIFIYRQEVRAFTEKQIALLTSFASQAVIAIENTRLLNELRESLQQQTATADVLKVISRSTFDLQTVLNTLVESAARLCEAYDAVILLRQNERLHVKAHHGPIPVDFGDWPIGRGWVTGRAFVDRTPVHVYDLQACTQEFPDGSEMALRLGHRTILAVPLQSRDEAIGAIAIRRTEVRPFTDKQIELVETYADQAVVAIENARLLDELRQALEQQTATSAVLGIISRSPGELDPVFKAILENAARICQAQFGTLNIYDGSAFRSVALHNPPPQFAMRHGEVIRPHPESGLGYVARTKQIAHIDDIRTRKPYLEGDKAVVGLADLAGARTLLIVPMLKEDKLIGTIAIYRQEVRPFTDKQIALLQNFAAQAVIAIENTGLLNELRESLQQQTATADVLRVISSSPGDLQPVFEAMLENAVRICDAKFGNIYRWDGEVLRILASLNTPPALAEARRHSAVRPTSQVRRMVETKTTTHVADLAADPGYIERRFPAIVDAVELGGVRTFLTVPMVKENELVGSFSLYRQEVRPFTDKQIALVTNFAAQAVIAIENARLLNELRQRTDELSRSVGELRALGEVSQAVNSTLDLETVLSTIVAKAVQLSGTEAGAIYVFDDLQRLFQLRATYGMDQELIDALTQRHIGMDDPNVRLLLAEREPMQVADLREEVTSDINEITLRAGYRARLLAPLCRGEDMVGMLVVRRKTPGAFPQNTVDLIKTFAAQSALAIENARLFENVEASLEHLRTAQDRLVQTEKLASLGQLTAGIAHEIKNPLNFVNNFSAVSVELIDELREALGGVHVDSKLRAEIAGIADMLQGNLDKVVQHGKRADAIVKNMLLHSRQGSGEHRPVDINALVEESLNLAYHGARAEKQGFNITLERSFDPAAGEADLFPQEITRALLNLISNGFYAATKRKVEANGGDYEPTLAAATKNLGDRVEIRIRDNGTGIQPEVKEKLFNPFFTTKPAGEGTGLGLSISHDIIVKQHGGSIEVDTQPGEFTEFRIVLPRAGASLIKSGERA